MLARYAGLALAIVAGVLLLLTGATTGLEEKARQVRDSFHDRTASGHVTVVEIDAKSLAAVGRWPWSRRLHGQLIDQLRHLGSDTIAFDVDFSAHSNPVDDGLFAAALARAEDSVILATFRQPASMGTDAVVENVPIDALRDHAMLASVNVRPEQDGQLASYSYGVVTNGVPRPSLAAMVAGIAGEMDSGFRIDTDIDPASIARVSAIDVLSGKADPRLIEGKTILIGATAIELRDFYTMPGHGIVPGIIAHALAAETLFRGSEAAPLDPVYAVIFALAVVALMLRVRGSATQTLVRIVAMAGLVGLPFALEWQGGTSIAVVPALLIIIVEWVWTATRAFAIRIKTERMTDHVTGLPNARALASLHRRADTLSVVVIRFGWFEEMDAVLDDPTRAQLMQRMLDRLSVGLPHQSFHALAPGIMAWAEPQTDTAALIARIESTSALFRAPLHIGDRTMLVTPNFGLCMGDGRHMHRLVAHAMVAARHGQDSGQCWSIHSDAVADQAQRAQMLLADVDAALVSGDIYVAYQPKWSIAAGRVCGAEALARWNHPVMGPISPDHFIPLLENSGNMARITLAIVDTCLADLRRWHDDGAAFSVAINISASLLSDTPCVDALHEKIAAVGPLNRFVTLEVTESAAVDHTDVAVAVLTSLRALGVRISIDDYGTGRATLAYLKAFPADEVKIDKSFVTNMVTTVSDQILVRSTIELARELNFQVVAEGVEDAECLAQLAAYGCDTAQGWAIGRPVDAQAFHTQWVRPPALENTARAA
jgi:diguanylate cyclase